MTMEDVVVDLVVMIDGNRLWREIHTKKSVEKQSDE